MTRPCSDCPWRKDAPPGYWHPDHFRDIWRNCQDDGLNVMLCHKATKAPESERGKMPCIGWSRVMGFDAIGVRMLVLRGALTEADTAPQPGDPELYASFAEMMRANGIDTPQRNRRTERE